MNGQYLEYETQEQAWAKAEEEGRLRHPVGWANNEITKYVTSPVLADNEKWVLDVSDYESLTVEETNNILTEVLFRWETDDWEY